MLKVADMNKSKNKDKMSTPLVMTGNERGCYWASAGRAGGQGAGRGSTTSGRGCEGVRAGGKEKR